MQMLVNGLATGCSYGLIAIGFSIVFSGCRFLHVAHAAVYAAGAYIMYFLLTNAGLSLPLAFASGVLGSAAIGAAMELAVYRPLRRSDASPLILLVASLGMFVVLQNLISILFGDDTKMLGMAPVREGALFLGARITSAQAVVMASSMLLCVVVWPLLRFTQIGRIYRAVSTDPQLARVYGVQLDLVILLVFVIGSALAGLSGILVGFDLDLSPRMGFNALLMGLVAVIVGGMGSVPGSMLGGLLVGVAQHLSAAWLPTQWQMAVTFAIVVAFLVVRPHGFLGRPLQARAI